MPIWQLCANLLIPNCLRSNLSYSPLAALELYVNAKNTQTLRPINSALDGITSANPFMYIENAQVPGSGIGSVPDSTQIGTVAPISNTITSFGKSYYALDVNAVKQSFPALIIEDAKGNEYVNYTQLVPILVQAIKELKTELDDLNPTCSLYAYNSLILKYRFF